MCVYEEEEGGMRGRGEREEEREGEGEKEKERVYTLTLPILSYHHHHRYQKDYPHLQTQNHYQYHCTQRMISIKTIIIKTLEERKPQYICTYYTNTQQ